MKNKKELNRIAKEGKEARENLKRFLWKKLNPNDEEQAEEILIETYDEYPVALIDICDSDWAEKLVHAYNCTYGSGINPDEIQHMTNKPN